jgi:hypothetical protein
MRFALLPICPESPSCPGEAKWLYDGEKSIQAQGRSIMRRLWALGFLLFVSLGCFSDSDKRQWNEALKDLQGDNMQMRGLGTEKSTDSKP